MSILIKITDERVPQGIRISLGTMYLDKQTNKPRNLDLDTGVTYTLKMILYNSDNMSDPLVIETEVRILKSQPSTGPQLV